MSKDKSSVKELTSNNSDVINQSLKIINENIRKEKERGKSAELRANTLIGFSGAGAAAILALSKILLDNNQVNLKVLQYFLYFSALMLIWKSIWYAIKSTRTVQMNRLTPDLIYEIQPKDKISALKHEIKWKFWEYNQMKQPHTEKLFWLNRAQRNLTSSIFFILLIGIVSIVGKLNFPSWPWWAFMLEYIAGSVSIIFCFVCDNILDRLGIWYFNPT